jgi:hypothetical protein
VGIFENNILTCKESQYYQLQAPYRKERIAKTSMTLKKNFMDENKRPASAMANKKN